MGVTSSWKSRSATPEDEDEEDVEEVKNMNELFYKTPRRPRLSTSQSHQDRFARNVSREAAWVALRAARAAKAAQIESMKLVMPCYDVKTQINIPFVCVTIINDFGFGGLPLAQFHFRFATLMLRDEPDLLSSKPKRSVRLSVVCSALGYSSNVSTWEELMSPWTLSIDMNSKEEEKTTVVSDDDHQDRILRRLSERSESSIFIRTAGAINLTFTVELLNSLILSLNKFQSEIVKNVGSNTTDSPLQVSTPPSSPHLLSRQTEDEMIGVGMFYLRIENRCGVPQYFVHEMYRKKSISEGKESYNTDRKIEKETYLKSFTLRSADIVQTSLPAHLQTIDFDSLKMFRRQQQEKRRHVYVRVPSRDGQKSKHVHAAMIPVDSLGHHLFDLDHVTIRVSLKRLRLPEGPRISESHPICAMMCLAGEIKRIITRQSTFTEDLYFEKIDPSLILQSQVSLSFLRHPFEAPQCIVAQVKPGGCASC